MTLPSISTRFAAGIIVLSCAGTAFAGQDSTSATRGSGLYVNYCGSCHGPMAKGNGPMAAALTKKPSDLTTIAKRNGGKFPSDTVFRTIDGRTQLLGHGGQMPVWGDALMRGDGATPEATRARIESLVAYLESIQQK